MGRQLATLMTQRDTQTLITRLRETESFQIVHSRSQNDRPNVVASIDMEQNERLWLYYFLVRNDDINSIVMKEVPTQNHWVVDSLRSPVVEFTRSFCDGRQIRVGRFWYEKGYFGAEGEEIIKPQPFLDWADLLFKAMRRHLRKAGDQLVGTETSELITAGKLQIIS